MAISCAGELQSFAIEPTLAHRTAKELVDKMCAKNWVLSLLFYVSAISSTFAAQPMEDASEWAVCHSRFATQIDIIATDSAIDCGFLRLRDSSQRFSEIKACARMVAETDKAFKFGHSDWGDDSIYCHAAIRDPSGQLWSYVYDSDTSGGSSGPAAISVSKCRALSFERSTIGQHSFFKLSDCEVDETLSDIF